MRYLIVFNHQAQHVHTNDSSNIDLILLALMFFTSGHCLVHNHSDMSDVAVRRYQSSAQLPQMRRRESRAQVFRQTGVTRVEKEDEVKFQNLE